ncbi:hypothetical protein KBA41_07250 [Candidatus Ozemobacteraceae bacterium]|nr:hypothetical protein [Candidatus Ozemobacteraceae bacterium]
MQRIARSAAAPSGRFAAVSLIWLCLLTVGTAGCRFTGKPSDREPTKQERERVNSTWKPASGNAARQRPSLQSVAAESPAVVEARKREEKIVSDLERVSAMMKGRNYEGALREADRVQRDNPRDPNVTMRTSYLKAMIFHRMNDVSRRKEAMTQMLKSMEEVQKDPRFRAAFEDGTANAEIIKMSIDRAGDRYDAN